MKLRGLLIVALIGGVGWWAYKTRPTVTRLVDDLTRPLMGSRAVVKESEYKRVSDAAPGVPEDGESPGSMIREGMTKSEVEEILGRPERVEEFKEKQKNRVRWTYVAARRVLVFEEGRDGRVLSIEIR